MSRHPDDHPGDPAKPADPTAGTGKPQRVEPLQALNWSELDTSADWPAHFIVRPNEPDMGAPSGIELPVLTVLAEGDDDWADSPAPGTPASSFAPTVFGPKLRRVDEDDDDALRADPDSAPASLQSPRSGFANWSYLWLALLVLLGVVGAAWLWWPGLRAAG